MYLQWTLRNPQKKAHDPFGGQKKVHDSFGGLAKKRFNSYAHNIFGLCSCFQSAVEEEILLDPIFRVVPRINQKLWKLCDVWGLIKLDGGEGREPYFLPHLNFKINVKPKFRKLSLYVRFFDIWKYRASGPRLLQIRIQYTMYYEVKENELCGYVILTSEALNGYNNVL